MSEQSGSRAWCHWGTAHQLLIAELLVRDHAQAFDRLLQVWRQAKLGQLAIQGSHTRGGRATRGVHRTWGGRRERMHRETEQAQNGDLSQHETRILEARSGLRAHHRLLLAVVVRAVGTIKRGAITVFSINMDLPHLFAFCSLDPGLRRPQTCVLAGYCSDSSQMRARFSTLLLLIGSKAIDALHLSTTALDPARMQLRTLQPIATEHVCMQIAQPLPPPAAAQPEGLATTVLRASNGATKWLVVFAQTAAVATFRDLVSPYIVIGSIAAAFSAASLKRLVNQQRPDGSPFSDPGMPSSHALVGTFAATAWALRISSMGTSMGLLASAVVISALRVVTGCHTWPQVAVGSALGAAFACLWMALGAYFAAQVPTRVAVASIYSAYVLGSALFIARKMDKWGPSAARARQ